MNSMLCSLLAEMYAANARVEGMKAKNQAQIAAGNWPVYSEADFEGEVIHLSHIAEAMRNW